MTTNKSGLVPLGRAVLVKMIELDELKADLIAIPDHVRAQSAVMETRAEVIAIGDACWVDELVPRRTWWGGTKLVIRPRAKVGDKVIVTRMAGYVAKGPKDHGLYRMVNDRDIFCRIEES